MSYWCYQMNSLTSANRVSWRLGVECTQMYTPPCVPVTDFTFYQRRVFENVEVMRAIPNWVCSWGQWRSFHSVSTSDHKCLQLTFSLHTKAYSHCQHSSPRPKEQLGDPSLWLSRLISARDPPSCWLETWQPSGNFLKHPLRFFLLLLLRWIKVLKELDLVLLFNLWTKSFPIWILNYLDGLSWNSPCSSEKGVNNKLNLFYDLSSQ